MSKFDDILDKINQLDTKTCYIIFYCILGMILILDVLFLMTPQFTKLSKINTESKNLKSQIEAVEGKRVHLASFQEQTRLLEDQINSIHSKIRTRQEIPLVLEEASRLANEHGVKIDQLMPIAAGQSLVVENEEGKYFTLPILIEARSGYHDFGRFINSLESRNLFLNLEEYRISSNENDSQRHNIRMTMNTVIIEKI